MSLRPQQPLSPVPDNTVRTARAAFPRGNPYALLRDRPGAVFGDADFADLYPRLGQPAYAPSRLALVTLMQFREGLSDRQAAEAVRARIDWKYLLALDLADAGFDHSVLCEFRGRLLGSGGADRLLARLLDAAREGGLLKARNRQRTDSTHVLAAIRTLNRVELAAETLRAALNAIAAAARVRETTKEGRRLYAQRQGVEGTISQAVRSFGLRRARYRGLAKAGLQHVATAAAIDLDRLAAWFAGRPLAPTRASRFGDLATRQDTVRAGSEHRAASRERGPARSLPVGAAGPRRRHGLRRRRRDGVVCLSIKSIVVGRGARLARYPVKSMAGEVATELDLRWTGAHGDRQYAFVRAGDRSRFPWLTARVVPDLILHRAAFRDPADPRRSPVDVALPDGTTVPLDDPAVAVRLAEAAGVGVELLQVGRGVFDAMPISLASTAALAAVDRAHGAALDPRRFRLNVVVESEASDAAWRGGVLAFGDPEEGVQLAVHDGIPRCAMVAVDPDTAAQDPSVLRTVAQRFGNTLGSYATALRRGPVRVGDPVHLLLEVA